MNVGTWIPSVIVAVAVCEPDVPVSVSVYVPTAAELSAVKIIVLLPVVGLGANEAVTPEGRPDTERLTPPVNPYWFQMFRYEEVDVPWPISRLLGAERVKVGTCTPKLNVVVAVCEPDVPVIVTA